MLHFEEGEEMFVKVHHGLRTEYLGGYFVVLDCLFISVDGEEYHDFVTLEVLFCAVELLVVLKQAGV